MVITGLQASAYPEDAPGQKKVYVDLLTPIVERILGTGVEFELSPRRGFLRGTVLPPVEIDLKQVQLASRFRAEGARLSRAKQHGLGSVYFNPCITLATRQVSIGTCKLNLLTVFVCYLQGSDRGVKGIGDSNSEQPSSGLLRL